MILGLSWVQSVKCHWLFTSIKIYLLIYKLTAIVKLSMIKKNSFKDLQALKIILYINLLSITFQQQMNDISYYNYWLCIGSRISISQKLNDVQNICIIRSSEFVLE